MYRHWRKAALRCSAIVLAVAVVILVASGIAAATEASGVPAKLVGLWSRNVSQKDWARQSVVGFPTGVFKMVIKKGGGVLVYTPGDPSATSTSFTASADGRLTAHSDPICSGNGRYRWKVTRNLLTITKIADPECPARIALYTGVWKRK